MTLDKIDLLDRKFSRSLIGYRRDEVDRLLAEAADSIGCLAEEKMALCRANDALRREMAELRAREQARSLLGQANGQAAVAATKIDALGTFAIQASGKR